MKIHTKTLVCLAALTTLTTGALITEAQAQPMPMGVHQQVRNDELQGRIDHLRSRLDYLVHSRAIGRGDYRRLIGRLNGIAAQKHRAEMSGRGLDRDDAMRLNGKLDALQADAHIAASDLPR